MRNIITIIALSIFSLNLGAQKIIEKNIDYTNQFIEMDVKFASEIEVKTWDRATVYIKADITTEDGKYLDLYLLEIDESDTKINIDSDATPIFKAFQKEREEKYPNRKNYCCNDFDYVFNYVLYVPKNAKLKVSSINGNLKSDIIEGDLTADLINGDIDIKDYTGNLDLSSINGEIDLPMINTTLMAETIHGDIYADEKLKFKSSSRHVGQKITGNMDNAKNSLRLNTINGNMYLRL